MQGAQVGAGDWAALLVQGEGRCPPALLTAGPAPVLSSARTWWSHSPFALPPVASAPDSSLQTGAPWGSAERFPSTAHLTLPGDAPPLQLLLQQNALPSK